MTTHPRPLTRGALVLLALAASLHAQTPTLEERLARLEAALARLESRLGDTVSADELAPTLKEYGDLTRQIGWDGKSPFTLAKAAGKVQKLSIGGYLQIQGETGDAPDSRFNGINDRFLLRRARLTIKGSFAEDFDFTVQSDFGNNSLGNVTGARAQLADLFVAWKKFPYAHVQVGQFKTPFGYEQLLADTKVITIERSLPNDQLTYSRQIGLSVSGANRHKNLTYSAGLFNGNGVNNGNNDNDRFLFAGRVGIVPWSNGASRLALGLNGVTTRDRGTFIGDRDGYGLDAQFSHRGLELAAEYLHQRRDPFVGATTNAAGWSTQASYLFPGKTWQGVVRYEQLDTNQSTANTTSENWLFGLNYLIKGDDLRLSLNYMVGDPAGPLSSQDRLLGRLQIVF